MRTEWKQEKTKFCNVTLSTERHAEKSVTQVVLTIVVDGYASKTETKWCPTVDSESSLHATCDVMFVDALRFARQLDTVIQDAKNLPKDEYADSE